MKRLGITQRVEVVADYGERRDCLDQRWSAFAQELRLVPVPLPNLRREAVPSLLDALELDAVVISGGNSLSLFDPDARDAAPERDVFESALIDEALNRAIPIVGVCRGMQMINVHLGGDLGLLKGHIATRHDLTVVPAYASIVATPVNSFHQYAIPHDCLAPELVPIASDADKNVEAFAHRNLRIAGVMWHPEREAPFRAEDTALFERLLK